MWSSAASASRKAGNFIDHSHPHPLPGQNVLSVVEPLCPTAWATLSPPDRARGATDSHNHDQVLFASARQKMFDARSRRVRPHLDDKILASWNGLMLGAMARAGVVLGEEKYVMAAEKNLEFIRAKLWEPPPRQSDRQSAIHGTLFHRWRDGGRDSVQLLEGYAFLLAGVVELYEATLVPETSGFCHCPR